MILNQQHEVRVARRPLESFLRRVKRELGLNQSDVTVCLISDKAMARLNQNFRKKKRPTDVLSFPQEKRWRVASGPSTALRINEWREEKKRGSGGNFSKDATRRGRKRPGSEMKGGACEESGPRYLGDIAISPATARRYAKNNGRHLASELRVLILHGVLHLLGYDHERDQGQMDKIEQKLRRRFGLI